MRNAFASPKALSPQSGRPQFARPARFEAAMAGPYGPYIVTRDEIPDPQTLTVRTVLNGQEMQISNTRNMVFGVAKLISYISGHIFPVTSILSVDAS